MSIFNKVRNHRRSSNSGDITLKFCPKFKCPKCKYPKFLVFNVVTEDVKTFGQSASWPNKWANLF